MKTPDAVVIGGGAAGLMCAIEAGKRGRAVIVLERSEKVGKKILISGGGRCNFTNLHTRPENFVSANAHFCKSALARFSPRDFIALVERHGIAHHEKELGQLFCDSSARQIVRMLETECEQVGVRIRVDCAVESVARDNGVFTVATDLGPLQTAALVVATGGLSIPKMGATGFGYQLARQFGHHVVDTRAGLVPLTFGGDQQALLQGLSGVSLPVRARCNGHSFEAGMLITHRGLSGPAILQASSYWHAGDELVVNLLPDTDVLAWLVKRRSTNSGAELKTQLAELLPKRLAQRLCESELGSEPLQRYGQMQLRSIAERLENWRFYPDGSEGYRTAEVTCGGVDTDELSSATMASRRVPGLYFIGEVVDVTGQLGGFNFQWAWASGHAAGTAV